MEAMEEDSKPVVPAPTVLPAPASSPQSEAVTNELQDLSLQPAPNLLPIHERKNGELVILQKFIL